MTKAEYQKLRAETWAQAWARVAGAITCKLPNAATTWADECVKEFDKRFKAIDLVDEKQIRVVRPTKLKTSDLKFIR